MFLLLHSFLIFRPLWLRLWWWPWAMLPGIYPHHFALESNFIAKGKGARRSYTHVGLTIVLPTNVLLRHVVIVVIRHHCIKRLHDLYISDLPPLLHPKKGIGRRVQPFRVLATKVEHVNPICAFRCGTAPLKIKPGGLRWIPELRRDEGGNFWVLGFGAVVRRG